MNGDQHLKDNGVKIFSAMENIPETQEGIILENRTVKNHTDITAASQKAV